MKYIVGIDGGGTKTRCVVGDREGHVLADYWGGPSNHQSIGPERAQTVFQTVFEGALKEAGIDKSQVEFAFLGLAGADLPSDFELLYGLCNPIFAGVPYKIVNDTWISMRSGLRQSWGAVTICGTGANAAARDAEGKEFILRSLGYDLGMFGGGGDITRRALHYAFRADESTSRPTMLQEALPPLFGAVDMEGLLALFYPQRQVQHSDLVKVPPLVFELATKGDATCQDILIHMGHELGETMGGVITRVGMQDVAVPVVLGGSIFGGSNPLLIDEFTTTLHRAVPKAYITVPVLPNVAGAYLSAMDSLGLKPEQEVYDNLQLALIQGKSSSGLAVGLQSVDGKGNLGK